MNPSAYPVGFCMEICHEVRQQLSHGVRIRELDYENLESWEQVIPVVEPYFHCRVVPNHVFPLLAPLVPLLGIRDNGRIDLLLFQDMFFLKDLGDGMRRYLEWIRGGKGAVLVA